MSTAVAHDDRQDDGEMLRLLRDAATTFAKRAGVGRSRALRKTRPGFDRAVWKEMAEQGWLGILIPENLGGQGLGAAEMAVVVEELAHAILADRRDNRAPPAALSSFAYLFGPEAES